MNCLYHAYIASGNSGSYHTFQALRFLHQGPPERPVQLWAALNIIQGLHGEAEMQVLHFSTNDLLRMALEDFGYCKQLNFEKLYTVETLTVAPAIYLLLGDQHAVWANQIPSRGYPLAAIKLGAKHDHNSSSYFRG